MGTYDSVSTGMKGFDQTIDMLRLGDNVVWQVNSIEDYKYVVQSYVEQAKLDKRNIIYIRFGQHESIINNLDGVKVYELDPYLGFEDFTTTVHNIIKNEGFKVFYIFDSLTDLQQCWYSDLMTTNFFKVTCPYIYQFDAIAYFGLMRNAHTYDTIAGIRETTQLLLDVYKVEEVLYIHPLKVSGRYSPTMFFPHKIIGDTAISITSSADAAQLFSKFNFFVLPKIDATNH